MTRDPDGYTVLHFPGDVVGGDPTGRAGQILGADEFGRPYEIIDCELIAAPPYEGCLDCYLPLPHTHVHLQYATPDTLRRAAQVLSADSGALSEMVRVQSFWSVVQR